MRITLVKGFVDGYGDVGMEMEGSDQNVSRTKTENTKLHCTSAKPRRPHAQKTTEYRARILNGNPVTNCIKIKVQFMREDAFKIKKAWEVMLFIHVDILKQSKMVRHGSPIFLISVP